MSSPATSWREKLHECETQADSDSRIGWLRRTYARIYRYLISQYGAPPPDVEHRPMPFVDRTEELAGKGARTLGQIRHTLKDISANQLVAAPLPRREIEVWVTVAVEGRTISAVASLDWLGSQGIEARVVREGRRRVVRVRREDADEVFRLIGKDKDLPQFLRQSRGSFHLDDNTIQQRTRFVRTHGQLSLIAFATSWGVLLCAVLLRQIDGSPIDSFLIVAAVLCILSLTESGLHLMRRAR